MNSDRLSVVSLILALPMGLSAIQMLLGIGSSPDILLEPHELYPSFAVTALLLLASFLLLLVSLRITAARWLGVAELQMTVLAGIWYSFVYLSVAYMDWIGVALVTTGKLLLLLTILAGVGVVVPVFIIVKQRADLGRATRAGARLLVTAAGAALWVFALYVARHSGVTSYRPSLYVVLAGIAGALLLGWGCYRLSPRSAAVSFGLVLLASTAFGAHFARSKSTFIVQQLRNPSASGQPSSRVLLLTIDSLRADMLSCYRETAPATPNLDALAADSTRFANAYAAAPWTAPSIASIMTGLPTFGHDFSELAFSRTFPLEFPVLAEQMRDGGHATAAVVENPGLGPERGLLRGFQNYTHFPRPTSLSHEPVGRMALRKLFPEKYFENKEGTEAVTQSALAWLEQNRESNFFLWVHYWDPHLPYAPPEDFLPPNPPGGRFGNRFDQVQEVRAGLMLSARERNWIRRLYEAEVRYVDYNVGKLLSFLKENGMYDETLIVMSSDHGEEFWEHGGLEHGHSLHEELIRVPLMIKPPHSKGSSTVTSRVSNRRIMPTILEVAGLPIDDSIKTPGSLVPFITDPNAEGDGDVMGAGLLYYEEQEAILHHNLKLIRKPGEDSYSLYDLDAGRQTKHPAAGGDPRGTELLSLLETLKTRYSAIKDAYSPVIREADPDSRSLQQLKGLGYLQ